MKVVLLAGGYGTRIGEESVSKPKPMVEIGGKPILWHIMKYFSSYGHNEFIVCLGYKGYSIKSFFSDYYLRTSNVTIDLKDNSMKIHDNFSEPWKITLIETGLDTMTGGRIKRIQEYIKNEDFFMTYGDGLSDIDLDKLLKCHKAAGKVATVSAVICKQRFGIMEIENKGGKVKDFREKSMLDSDYINGGFMVLTPKVFSYIDGDSSVFEDEPMKKLIAANQLNAYKHDGHWQCMDTMRDKNYLEELFSTDNAFWRRW